ncbi:MAG: hypothetical protein VKI81_02435 [Synechococcaceae cyanobacterium]|nr:hypothetical protein [Synechococcaceae cyanobacterium]
MGSAASTADLLAALEAVSRTRPDRVLRLRGDLEPGGNADPEPFELLIFRGFSSSTTHPTGFDPDSPALPEGSRIAAAELLEAPLRPEREVRLRSGAVETFLEAAGWD